jgi:hypothetical protein
MIVLLGWQFAVGEFIGGPIMIILLATAGGLVFSGPVVARALKHVRGETGGHNHETMTGVTLERQEKLESEPLRDKLHSAAAWSDASNYAVADVTMLRRELIIGYTVAGLLATLVPAHAWNVLFVHGHGFWTSVENALVGPLIAVVSWVCSIGNVPLAAALWSGGISFGGVIAFVFADLIAMPLVLIYRKLYGWELTLRMVALFYVIMAVAGLATEGVFSAFGGVPSRRTFSVSSAHFSWNYTTFLNILFIVLAIGVWWLARHRTRFGGGTGYAIDPVCGMQVRTNDAPATAQHTGHTMYFCSDHCRAKFETDPDRYSNRESEVKAMKHSNHHEEVPAIDPVCGMTVDPTKAAAHRVHEGRDFWFCAVSCATQFDADPSRFVTVT